MVIGYWLLVFPTEYYPLLTSYYNTFASFCSRLTSSFTLSASTILQGALGSGITYSWYPVSDSASTAGTT